MKKVNIFIVLFFISLELFSQSLSGLNYTHTMEMGIHKFNCIDKEEIYSFLENSYNRLSDFKINNNASPWERLEAMQRYNQSYQELINNAAKLYISVGENSQRGYVFLTYKPAQNFVIPLVPIGNITFYTNSGKKIQCIDRKMRSLQKINGEYEGTSLYYLTFSELKIIASEGISQMYFSLGDEYGIEMDKHGITDLNFYFQKN